jgi:hypothetical protein
MKEIQVEINIDDYPHGLGLTPAMWESWVVGKLKEAGVPVEGTLTFNGIKSGILSRFDNPEDFGKTIWKWREEKETKK